MKQTLNQLQETYHWTDMVGDVMAFINACPECQIEKNYPKAHEVHIMIPILMATPFT